MTARVPASTYRVQVSAEQDLLEVAGLLDYLHDLGADWVYLSPLLTAEPGSDHGYDVVDHDHVDPTRGGTAGLAAVSERARELGMGVLVDVVPNHVGVATPVQNGWWWDLLTHGRESAYAAAFDVDWDAGDGRVRIPVVGDDDQAFDAAHPADAPAPGTPEARVGHLALVAGDLGQLTLRYHDHVLPVAPGTAQPGDDADEVHARQAYQLVNWRVADAGLNYRRFFAVNTLAGIRVELPAVRDESHQEIRRWFDEGLVDGLRVDHPDGLRDPRDYLDDLAAITGGAYVLVEKILEPGEELPTDWATAGTTGYDAMAHVDRVLVDPAGEVPLTALDARLRGRESPGDDGATTWHALVHGTKRTVADTILHSEVRRIVRDLRRERPDVVDALGDDAAVDAVSEVLACFGVYRSYLSPEDPDAGREHLDAALADARGHRPDLAATLDALAGPLGDPDLDATRRLQQTSGMVMAKGVEDCAFYRWSPLTSLTEVGGDPSVFALDVAGFHTQMAHRQAERPHAMTAGSTHDTKRGEDVRARISVLAEVPDAWEAALARLLDLAPLPDPGFGNLLWQAVVGAWPATAPDRSLPDDLRSRLHGYAEKAMREAGDRTTWTAQDQTYEDAVHAAVDAAIDRPEVHEVVTDLVERLAGPGWSNALSAKLLSLTVPGVPDVYQGSELWEQSLVDPDNRRPVDFARRTRALAALPEDAGLVGSPDDDGMAKLRLVTATLRLRRDRPELFTTYAPVTASGPAADHVVALDRGGVVAVATRLPVGLAARGGWDDTRLDLPRAGDGARWRDVLTDRPVGDDLAGILATYPVALLVREG